MESEQPKGQAICNTWVMLRYTWNHSRLLFSNQISLHLCHRNHSSCYCSLPHGCDLDGDTAASCSSHCSLLSSLVPDYTVQQDAFFSSGGCTLQFSAGSVNAETLSTSNNRLKVTGRSLLPTANLCKYLRLSQVALNFTTDKEIQRRG
jgi:hypothetical protein